MTFLNLSYYKNFFQTTDFEELKRASKSKKNNVEAVRLVHANDKVEAETTHQRMARKRRHAVRSLRKRILL